MGAATAELGAVDLFVVAANDGGELVRFVPCFDLPGSKGGERMGLVQDHIDRIDGVDQVRAPAECRSGCIPPHGDDKPCPHRGNRGGTAHRPDTAASRSPGPGTGPWGNDDIHDFGTRRAPDPFPGTAAPLHCLGTSGASGGYLMW